jgi:phosphoglycerate dehydrogenase-like enzyme/predicted dehydrogenase
MLVGCGKIAQGVHLPALNSLKQQGLVDIVGLCDLDLNRVKALAEKYAIPQVGVRFEQVASASQPDAVSICLPPGPNVDLAVPALEQGLHAMCEKPPARNARQAARLAAAAASRPDLVTMIAFNRRFAPLYRKAWEQSQVLGPPHLFTGKFTRPGLGDSPSDGVSDWLTSDGSHALDLALATMGFPHTVTFDRRLAGLGPHNVWNIQLATPQGAATIMLDFGAGRRVERFEWSGPGYDVMLELPERAEWAVRGEAPESWRAAEISGQEDFFTNYGFLGEYEAFIRAIQGEGPRPGADFNYGHAFMRLVEAILAGSPGEPIQLPAYPEPPPAISTGPGQSPELAPAAPERPLVYILQPAQTHAKYFAMEQMAQLAEVCDITTRTEENWPDSLAQAHAVITGWDGLPLTPELLDKAKNLRLVVVMGASVKAYSPEILMQRQILLGNTADAIARSVAEHCLLLTLAGLRHLGHIDRQMHQGAWPPSHTKGFSVDAMVAWAKSNPVCRAFKPVLKPLGKAIWPQAGKKKPAGAGGAAWNDLQGQTVGLVGWGHIAAHFCTLLEPFSCNILVNSDHLPPAAVARHRLTKASLGEVLGAAKVVSLHKGLTDKTVGMMGAQELALLQPGSVLVNTARGALINEEALVKRLRQKDLVAALDVFCQEPLPAKHPLRTLPNVILTPHNASTTRECFQRVGQQALIMIMDWLKGSQVATLAMDRLATMT